MNYKSANRILRDRIRDKPEVQAAVLHEKVNIECARFIYAARTKAGLSQKALGALIGTSQAAIARLENADYTGRTFQTMQRVAAALGYECKLEFVQTRSDSHSAVK